jgi:hydrogenase-4 component E
VSFTETDLPAAFAALMVVWMCGVSRVQSHIRGLALQTVAMAIICVMVGIVEHEWHYYLLAVVVFAVKAVAIPGFLSWTAKRLDLRKDEGAFVGPAISLPIGCAIGVVAYLIGERLAVESQNAVGSAGMAMVLVLLGMYLMVTRRLAMSQLVGLISLENGIFLYSLTQARGMPLIIEMGAVFEILMGVLVAGIVLFRLNRSFEHIDVTDLRRLQR